MSCWILPKVWKVFRSLSQGRSAELSNCSWFMRLPELTLTKTLSRFVKNHSSRCVSDFQLIHLTMASTTVVSYLIRCFVWNLSISHVIYMQEKLLQSPDFHYLRLSCLQTRIDWSIIHQSRNWLLDPWEHKLASYAVESSNSL